MDRKTYIDTVLSALCHVTGDERAAIRAELEGHMEDHMEGLLELGYEPELAEERTLAAMGDPQEVGRELNKQYTGWGWVLLSRVAVLLTVVLCLQALLGGLGQLGVVADSIMARIYPDEPSAYSYPAATERLDIRLPVGNDVLRVYRISVRQPDGDTKPPEAEVLLCAYDRIPGGIVSYRLEPQTWLENAAEEKGSTIGNSRGNWRVEYWNRRVEIQPEDTYVTLCCETYGEQIRLELPLPEEGTS